MSNLLIMRLIVPRVQCCAASAEHTTGLAWWHGPKGAEWTERVRAGRSALGLPRASELEGRNSLVEPRRDELTQALLDVASAAMRAPGTRVVFQ
eukprot:7357087-Prymnesium_polylepis.1